MAPIRIGLLGCGVVGTEVVRQLANQADDLAQRVGAPLELVGIAVRRAKRIPEKATELGVPESLFTTDSAELVRLGRLTRGHRRRSGGGHDSFATGMT